MEGVPAANSEQPSLAGDPQSWRIEPVATNPDNVHVWLRQEDTDARMPATWWPAGGERPAGRLEYGHFPDTSSSPPEHQAQAAFWSAHPAFVEALVSRILDGHGDLPLESDAALAGAAAVALHEEEADAAVPAEMPQTSAVGGAQLGHFPVIDGWSVDLLDTATPAGAQQVLLRNDVDDAVIGTFVNAHGKLEPADPEHSLLAVWVEEHANIVEELNRALASGRVPPLSPSPPSTSSPVAPVEAGSGSETTPAPVREKPSRRRRA